MANRAIIIMAKVPLAGTVKTRLQSVLTPVQCAELAEVFLQDTIRKAKTVCEKTIIAFFPPSEKPALQKILPDEIFFEQTGANLGERIFSAFEFAFAQKADSVVMIGTDSPTFPADFIEQAFEFLELETDAVLGQTADGGFYLIGLRTLRANFFENVAWSSPDTFEQVYRNIMDSNLHLREVPGWYDVDEPKDLKILREELIHNANARNRAPQTNEWMMSILDL